MTAKLPDEERLARARARKRAWWEAHPDYRADHYQRNLEKNRERHRANERQRRQALAAEAEKRQREVARVREWTRQNPEKRQEARQRYKEQNLEKYRAAQREYYHRNRQAILERRKVQGQNPEMMRAARRRYEERNREKRNAAARQRPVDPEKREKYRATERERKRLERRLQAAGLPPRQLHRTPAAERKANLKSAGEFFSRKRSRAELRRISEQDAPTPSNLLQEWARHSALIRRRMDVLYGAEAYLAKHGDRLRGEVELDSRARQLHGREPLDADAEVRRRALEAVRLAYVGMAPLKPATSTPPAKAVGGRSFPSRQPPSNER